MEEQIQPQKSELNSLGVKELFFKYFRFLPLFVICIALSLLGAYLYLRYATPIYQSGGSMVVKDESNSPASNEKFEQLFNQDGQKNIQSEIEFIRSRPMLSRVINRLDLNFSYSSVGKIKELDIYKSAPFRVQAFEINDSSALFILNVVFENNYGFRVNGEQYLFSFGQIFKNRHGVFRLVRTAGSINKEYNIKWMPTGMAADNLIGNLAITPKAQGLGILTLSLQGTNPQLVANVINQLMAEYQDATVEDKNLKNQRTLAFIDERLNYVESQVDSVTAQLIAYKLANNIVEPEMQSQSYFGRILETEKIINEQRAQLEIAQMVDSYLRNQENALGLVPSSLGLADPTLNTLISAYNVAQLERKMLMDGGVPTGNPQVQQYDGQIEKLRQNILENLRNIKAALNVTINDLRSRNSNVQAQIQALPAKTQKLIDIQRQQETKLAVYNILLQKREESAISRASTISNIKVLESAYPNNNPVKPNKRNIRLLAIFIGIVVPALFIFVLEIMNDKITSRNDIERLSDVTILGEVGHSYGKEVLVVKPNNRGIIAEQFRIIRSNLQYIINNIPRPVILVTSSFSGEGKSFISTNIGAVMALTGKRAIVLEFDIRKPKVLSHLNMPKKPGLTNYLLGKIQLEELPIPVPGHENLFLLACGPIPPNPAELLLDPKLNELFDYLRTNFDVIVMDTAPVGIVSDALTLSKFADATLYIARHRHTYKKQVGLIDEFYRQGKLPKISVILNDVKLTSMYGGNGYGYSAYGSGYFEEDEKPASDILTRWFDKMDITKWRKKTKKKV